MSIYYDSFIVDLQNFPDPEIPEDSIQGWGGDTTSNTLWITNDKEEYLIRKNEEIPVGWKLGRKLSTPFKNSKMQSEFSKKVNIEKRRESLKEAWNLGKYSNRDSTNIGKNQNWSEERRKHQSKMALMREKICCTYCMKYFQPGMAKRWHFNNCKMKNNE
jgi:hypothetical protein